MKVILIVLMEPMVLVSFKKNLTIPRVQIKMLETKSTGMYSGVSMLIASRQFLNFLASFCVFKPLLYHQKDFSVNQAIYSDANSCVSK